MDNDVAIEKITKRIENSGSERLNKPHSKSIQKQLKLKLIENRKKVLVKKIEATITELIYSESNEQPEIPQYLNKRLNYNYSYLANLFSQVKGITLKTFIITTKIERAKELLIKDEISIAEIATRLHYKSVSHLSTQFKSITGITPSYFLASELEKSSVA